MRTKRFLSLYYGSFTCLRSLQALWGWLISWVTSSVSRREILNNAVRVHYGAVPVFSLCSGRSAIAVCLKAAGIGAGDEVLLSAYTCLAVPTAVISVGAKPIYIDINAETLNVEADLLIKVLTPNVRAVIIQHTLGKCAPVTSILDSCRKRGILVIEDCALSLGSSIDGRYVGTFGDAAVFSMELSKTLSCGWGGILVVNSPKLSEQVTGLYETLPELGWWSSTRDLLQTVISAWCYQRKFFNGLGKYILVIGFRSRFFRVSTPIDEFDGRISPKFMSKMGSIQVGLAALQWQYFCHISVSCENNARALRETLAELNFQAPGLPTRSEVSVAPRVSFLVKDRSTAVHYFEERGIQLGQWFDGPLSPVPSSVLFNYQQGKYPVAERIARYVVNLPCHSRINIEDLAHIVATLREFARDYPNVVAWGD